MNMDRACQAEDCTSSASDKPRQIDGSMRLKRLVSRPYRATVMGLNHRLRSPLEVEVCAFPAPYRSTCAPRRGGDRSVEVELCLGTGIGIVDSTTLQKP